MEDNRAKEDDEGPIDIPRARKRELGSFAVPELAEDIDPLSISP